MHNSVVISGIYLTSINYRLQCIYDFNGINLQSSKLYCENSYKQVAKRGLSVSMFYMRKTKSSFWANPYLFTTKCNCSQKGMNGLKSLQGTRLRRQLLSKQINTRKMYHGVTWRNQLFLVQWEWPPRHESPSDGRTQACGVGRGWGVALLRSLRNSTYISEALLCFPIINI